MNSEDSKIMSARKAEQRRRRRAQAMIPLETWLPEQLIFEIDELKTEEKRSRETVIAALLAGTLRQARSSRPEAQMALA